MVNRPEKFDSPAKIIPRLIIFLVLSFLVFSPCLRNDFINWDEPFYIQKNELVRQLTFDNIRHIFNSYIVSNYLPLTILSFAVEYHFVQLDPFLYHLNNISLHVINALLVYIFISGLTQRRSVAYMVSLLFAIHPTRVESVAWIIGRKDVLYGFFFLITLILYLNYLKSEKKWPLLVLMVISFLCSLLSKQLAVSLPLILLLIDFYMGRKLSVMLFLEKIPFFVLSAIFGLIAVNGSYVPSNSAYPIGFSLNWFNGDVYAFAGIEPELLQWTWFDRIAMSSYATYVYFLKIFSVAGLSCFYPFPFKGIGQFSWYFFLPAMATLGGLCWLYRRGDTVSRRSIVFGVCFFMGTILLTFPVFGVTRTIVSDRYTYLPYIGLFLLIAEGISRFRLSSTFSPRLKRSFLFLGSIFIIYLSAATFNYCAVWKNSETLWSHVILQYPSLAAAYLNRGNYYSNVSNLPAALDDYNKAIALNPSYDAAFLNRGSVYARQGQFDFALRDYDSVIKVNPRFSEATRQKQQVLREIERRNAE